MKNSSKQKLKGITALELLYLADQSRKGLKMHGSDSMPEETETLLFYTKGTKSIWNKFCFHFTQAPPPQNKDLLSRKDLNKTIGTKKSFAIHQINSQGLCSAATIICGPTTTRLPSFIPNTVEHQGKMRIHQYIDTGLSWPAIATNWGAMHLS